MNVIKYDAERWPFPRLVAEALGVDDLQRAHEHVRPSPRVLTREQDQYTELHRAFYEGQLSWKFRQAYESFAVSMGRALIAGDFLYQRVPTFRAQLPQNLAVGEFHRDVDYGHQAEEINVWVPVTPVEDSTAVWICHGGERPHPCQPGEVLVFDGAILRHGNVFNTTGLTRVSFDFRLLPRAAYREGGMTVNGVMRFKLGEYWSEP